MPVTPPAPPAPPFPPKAYLPPTPPPPLPPRQLSSTPPARRGGTGKVVAAALVGAALAATSFVAGGLVLDDPQVATTSASSNPTAIPTAAPLTGDEAEPVVAVAESLSPSVVLIRTEDGLGSGVIYDGQGLIMTNAHVVGSARNVEVSLADGSTLEGEVLGRDTATDIAVVQVDADGALPAALLADDEPRVGQVAIALGSPFGLEQTVTAGVVSAVDRPVDNERGVVVGMIQTDAPINPGNSGGALANRFGEVIGINTMIYSQNGENNGIGFAVPIATAKGVADKLVAGESVERAFLGVSSQAPQDGSAGAQIVSVESGSPAADAGLRRGDVIVALDGTEMQGSAALAAAIGARQPGDVVTLEVVRADESLEIEVELGTKG